MKKLHQQITTSAEINRSLEQALSTGGNDLRNTEEIVSYLNNLCTKLANAKDFFNQTGFYNAVCKKVAKYVLSEASSIRAVTYRILRKASQLPDDLSVLLTMHMDGFAIRSLELDANFEERIEALRLCAMMLNHMNESTKSSENGTMKNDYSSTIFPENIYRALISIANCFFAIGSDRAKVEEREDELAFSCFAVIVEQAIVAPDLILNSVDTGWIVELLTNAIFNDHLSNFVCHILCAWLDSPQLRTQAKLRLVLDRIFASVIEIGLFEQKEPMEQLSNDSSQLGNFSHIFLNLLRTWAGVFSCFTLGDQKLSITSALSFLDYIGLNRSVHANNRKIRDLIIECCCEILELPYSKTRFTNWLHTTYYYTTMFHPDACKCSVRNEFILSEHEIYLKVDEQHSNVNDLLLSFRSAVIYLLINANLIQTLSRIILQDPDDPVALKATLLMHDVLLASSICLPMEWRLRILSLPTLIHNAYEIVSGSHISKKHPLDNGDYKLHKLVFTYADQRNVIVLLNRLDILNSISLSQKTQPLPITNLQLFVQSSPTATRLRKSKLSKMDFNDDEGDVDDVETVLGRLLFKAVESDGKLCWPVVDKLFQLLQNYYSCKDVPIKYSKKCYSIFRLIFNFITPAESSLINFDYDRFVVKCCCRAVHVSLLFAPREIQYKELLADFINDFIANISSDALLNGPLSRKNLVNTGAMYYFAFIGAISAIKEGRKMLEATPLLQLFIDLVKNATNVEYIKLIVSCLDYSSEDSFNRFVLQTALTCASEAGRKWTTQFLSILASHNINNFSVWGIKLLLGQLADSSAKVVRHALRLLHRWIPHYPESIYLIKDICLDGFGDAGTLLKTYLFSCESYVKNNFCDALSALDYWKKKFNMRYVEIIDEDVRVALLDWKRSIDGQYARSSNERIAKLGVPMPVHLYGQLARHDIGRELLLRSNEVERLLDVLRDSPLPTNTCQAFKLKGALYALGHIVAALTPNLLPSETVPIICRFAECCPVLSIRGAAFWVVNLIGNTQSGSILLSSLGWESSNFIVSKRKSNMLLLKTATIDINKIWIRCIDDKNPAQNVVNLKNEAKEEVQDYLMIRSQFRLPSFPLNKLLTFDSSVEVPINSTSVLNDKFLCFCGFWNPMENGRTKLPRKLDLEAAESRPVNLFGQSISLPRNPNFFLKNIFVVEEFIKHSCDSSLVKRKHRINSCFSCSWSKEYFGSKNVSEIRVPNEARDEIISVFLLQGSKCSLNSKKLLKNYLSNRKIFSSLCLYSDILVLLAQHNYNVETRRLVHELFADALQKASYFLYSKLSFREAYVRKP